MDSERKKWSGDAEISDLLKRVKKQGSPRILDLSNEDKERLYNWYKDNLDTLAPADQVDFMEEFMLHDLVSDFEASQIISKIGSVTNEGYDAYNERGRLGRFIARMLSPGKYYRSFYECYHAMKPGDTQEFIKEITTEKPEAAIMVIPFINSMTTSVEVSDASGEKIQKNIIEAYFASVPEASVLIDAALQYHKTHKEESEHDVASSSGGFSRSLLSWGEDYWGEDYYYKSNSFPGVRSLVMAYLSNPRTKGILYPYLNELKKGMLISPEEEETFYSIDGMPMPPDERTKEEQAEYQKIYQEIVEYNKPKNESSYIHNHPAEISPRKLAVRINALQDESTVRATRHVFKNFKEWKKDVKNLPTFLLEAYFDKGYPLFAAVDLLGLSKSEVHGLLERFFGRGEFSDTVFNCLLPEIKSLLKFNNESAPKTEAGIEEIIAKLLISRINEYGMFSYANQTLMLAWDNILSELKLENKEKLVEAISKRAPELWLINPRFAIENRVMPVRDLIRASSEQDPPAFIENYAAFLYHLKDLEEPNEGLVDILKSKALDVFEKNPQLVFKEDSRPAVNHVYSAGELSQFIEKHLQNPNADFLIALIQSPHKLKHKEAARQAFNKNDHLLIEVSAKSSTYKLRDIFSDTELLKMVMRNLSDVDFEDVFTGYFASDTIKTLATSSGIRDNFLKQLKESGEARLVSTVLHEAAWILKKHQEDKKTLPKEKKSILSTIQTKRKSIKILGKERALKDIKAFEAKLKYVERQLEELLSEKEEHGLVRFLEMGKETLIRICEKDPLAVFEAGVIGILGTDAGKFVLPNIDEYAKTYPDVLVRQESGSRDPELLNILGSGEYIEIFLKNIRSLAFRDEITSETRPRTIKIPGLLEEKIKEINPLLEVLREDSSPKNFYTKAVEVLRNSPFYDFFKQEVEAIAQAEVDLYGDEEPHYFSPKREFISLATRILLLSSSDLAVKNLSALNELNNKTRLEFINLIEAVAYRGLDKETDAVIDPGNPDDFKAKLYKSLGEFLKMQLELDFEGEFHLENVGSKGAIALATYYANKARGNSMMKRVFKEAVESALRGRYPVWKAWGRLEEPNAEAKMELLRAMQEAGLLPGGLDLQTYEAWVFDAEKSFEEAIQYELQDVRSSVRDILFEAAANQHVEENLFQIDSAKVEEQYSAIVEPFRALTARQEELKNKIAEIKRAKKAKEQYQKLTPEEETEYRNIQEKIQEYRLMNEEAMLSVESLRFLDRLKHITAGELETRTLRVGKHQVALTYVFRVLEKCFSVKHPDFVQDLRRMRDGLDEGNKRIFGGERVSRERLFLKDTVNLEVNILIGDEPVQTCQNYDSRSDLNEGLLSYVTDPAVKIIQVFDEYGKIIARSALRLLEREGGKPALFMEHIYSSNAHKKIKEIMVTFAKDKAKKMGINLYGDKKGAVAAKEQDGETQENAGAVLMSKGSRATYVYTDSGGGKSRKGKFKITNPVLLASVS